MRCDRGAKMAPGFVPEETATFEQIVWDSPVSFDRARVRELISPHWLAQQENVLPSRRRG